MRKLYCFAVLLFATTTFAAGRDLAPRPLGRSAYSSQTPLVAFAGGKYLTVWLEALNHAGWRYLGAFSDAEGERISQSAFVVVPYGLAGPAHLIGTGDSFALFFPQANGLRMMDLDLAGNVTGDRIVPVEGLRWDDVSIAWTGSQFVVLERTTDAARATFLDRGGAVARSIALPCQPSRHTMLAVRTDAIVAGVCAGAMRLDRIDANGSVTSTVLDSSFEHAAVVAAPATSEGALLAWSFPADESLRTAILSADGTMSALRTVAQGGFGQALAPLLLAKTTGGFLLPYTVHGNLRVLKLDESGALLVTNDGPANSVGFHARAASDGTDVLVADIGLEWQGSHIRARHVDANTEISAPEVLSITPARQLAPAIAAGSGSLVAAWTERQGATTSMVKAAHVAADGSPLGSSILATNASLASDDLAWNGAEYLAVIRRDDQLHAQRISAFGEPVGASTFLSDFPAMFEPHVAVVWAGDRWEIAWVGTEIFRTTVATDGTRSAVEPLPLEGPLSDPGLLRAGFYDVALAYDGKRVLIGWIEGRTVTDCRVTCIGSAVAFLATLDDTTAHPVDGPWGHFETLSIAPNASGVVVAGNGYSETHVVSFDANFQPIASRTFYGLGDVTWDGAAFVVAFRERQQLTVRRLDASLRDAARARVAPLAHPDTDDSAPSIAVAVSGNAIIGVQEVEANSGARAVAYVEQELGYEPQRRRTVRR